MPIQAISGNINPYAAEATVFNTQPFVQYAMQQEAKKQAAQDAIDAHLAKNMAIDYSKMREQDKADFANNFNKDVVEWAKANRDALRDRGAKGIEARLILAQKMEGKKAEIGSSIQQNDEDKKVDEYVAKLKAAGVEPDEQTIGVMANRGLSMYNNKFYKNPMTKETYGVKDLQNIYKEHNHDDWIKDITAGKVMNDEGRIGGTGRNIGNFETEYKTRKAYSDKDYMDILNNAAMSYEGRPSTKRYFDNQFHKLADAPTINNAFKQVTGRDIQNGKDAAIATAMASVQKEIIGKEKVKDELAKHTAMKNVDLSFENKKQDDDRLWALQYINKHLPKSQNLGQSLEANRPLNVVNDQLIIKSLSKNGKEPDKVYFNTETKKLEPIFYEREKIKNDDGITKDQVKKDGNGNSVIDVNLSLPQEIEQVLPNFINVAPKSKYAISEIKKSMDKNAKMPNQEQPKLSDYDKQVLDWVNNPNNAKHPNYAKFKNYLKTKGL